MGNSTGRPEVWNTKKVAAQVFELSDHFGVQKVRAVGCGMGANVLLHMALQQPNRLEAMVLISASHRLSVEPRKPPLSGGVQ